MNATDQKKKYIKKWDLSVPRLGMGINRLARTKDENLQELVVDLCMEKGINYFEVGHEYEGSENLLSKFIVNKYPREEYMVVNKFNHLHIPPFKNLTDFNEESFRNAAEKLFQEQLKKTGMEYFDFYLLHHVVKQSVEELERCGVITFLKDIKKRGLVNRIGYSTHADFQTSEQLFSMCDWDLVMLSINYFDWETQGIKEQYDFYTENNVPINVMCPLAGGNLTQLGAELVSQHGYSTPSDFSLKWVMSLENVAVTLSAMTSVDEVIANVKTLETFNPEAVKDENLASEMRQIIAKLIPCTNCRYCLSECPQNINIPGIFNLYNQFSGFKRYGVNTFNEAYSRMLPDTGGLKCLSCGLCTSVCPQNIDIAEQLGIFNAGIIKN